MQDNLSDNRDSENSADPDERNSELSDEVNFDSGSPQKDTHLKNKFNMPNLFNKIR